jgi:enoyl-CoA hydratase/carnithine racemase
VLDGQVSDDDDTRALFAQAFTGPDFLEGSSAFLARRKPQFGP